MSAVNVPMPARIPRAGAGPEEETRARLGRARAGDLSAFEEIVRQQQTRIYSLAYRMLRNREEAEDVTQEAFVKAFEALPSLRAPGALRTWLGRIAVTLCLSRLRSASYRREVATESLPYRPAAMPTMDEIEHSRLVREVLATLPPRYRQLIQACYLEGRSYHEVAGLTGTEMQTVKTRLFRARRCLRERLREALVEQ